MIWVLALLLVALVYAVRRYFLFNKIGSLEDIEPLGENVNKILREINQVVLTEGDLCIGEEIVALSVGQRRLGVNWGDLLQMFMNERRWIREIDRMRIQGRIQGHEECEYLHAKLTQMNCQTAYFLKLAALEKIMTKYSCVRACAAVHSYSQEALVAIELLELCGDTKANRLEGHF